jgi:tetratricopeptide (TPR) repeat protein
MERCPRSQLTFRSLRPSLSWMNLAKPILLFCLVDFLAGCSAYQVAGHVQTGRQALIINQPERALPYFLEAAQKDPDYIYRSMHFREGVWTYVGRAQYGTGRLKEAREALERALSIDKDDYLARLYLGLTLARSGDSRGFKEIETGMKGIHEWLEYMERTRPFEVYWDPLREIRGSIEKDLTNVSGKDFDRQQLIANAEWLGQRLEIEIDRARQDERRQFDRDFDRRRGLSIGVGF